MRYVKPYNVFWLVLWCFPLTQIYNVYAVCQTLQRIMTSVMMLSTDADIHCVCGTVKLYNVFWLVLWCFPLTLIYTVDAVCKTLQRILTSVKMLSTDADIQCVCGTVKLYNVFWLVLWCFPLTLIYTVYAVCKTLQRILTSGIMLSTNADIHCVCGM